MKKNHYILVLGLFTFFTFSNCSVVDDVKDTLNAAECAGMINDLILTESNERPCSAIIADIERIERDCAEYLDEDIRASFATARENCSGN